MQPNRADPEQISLSSEQGQQETAMLHEESLTHFCVVQQIPTERSALSGSLRSRLYTACVRDGQAYFGYSARGGGSKAWHEASPTRNL